MRSVTPFALLLAAAGCSEPEVELAERYELSDDQLHPEGGDYDPQTRAFYVGSLGRGNITRIHADGAESIFYEGTGEADRLTLGVRADVERRRLWVCSMLNDGVEPGVVWVFDLDSAAMTHELVLEDTFAGASCNDVDVDAQGRGYVTDRQNPNVYRVDLDDGSVEIWASHQALAPQLIGMNGVVVTPDEAAVIVTKYSPPRLLRIAFDDPTDVTDITFEGDAFMGAGGDISGADGLVMRGDELVVVFSDNILRLDLDAQWRHAVVASDDVSSGLAAGILAEGEIYAVKGEIVEFALEREVELPFALFRVDVDGL